MSKLYDKDDRKHMMEMIRYINQLSEQTSILQDIKIAKALKKMEYSREQHHEATHINNVRKFAVKNKHGEFLDGPPTKIRGSSGFTPKPAFQSCQPPDHPPLPPLPQPLPN